MGETAVQTLYSEYVSIGYVNSDKRAVSVSNTFDGGMTLDDFASLILDFARGAGLVVESVVISTGAAEFGSAE